MKSISEFTFHPIQGRISPGDESSVIKIWTDEAEMDPQEAARRISELVLLIRDGEGNIAGVSTAAKMKVKFLNENWFYQLRYFIVPAFRFAGLGFKLTKATVEHLEEKYLMEHERMVGVLAVQQNHDIRYLQAARKTILRNVPFVFAGHTSTGDPVQIYYFNNARI